MEDMVKKKSQNITRNTHRQDEEIVSIQLMAKQAL